MSDRDEKKQKKHLRVCPQQMQHISASKVDSLAGVSPSYRKKVSFYALPPDDNVTLHEFESFSYDRLRVLQEINAMKVRGMNTEQMDNRLRDLVEKYLPLRNSDDIRKDVISHYVMRLAYCKPGDRKFLMQTESQLLRFRLGKAGYTTVRHFLTENGISFEPVSNEEFAELASDLGQLADYPLAARQIIRVPFTDALPLVRRRRVLLRAGQAYVIEDEFLSVVLERFRLILADALAHTYKAWPSLREHYDQMTPLLDNLLNQYLGAEFNPKGPMQGLDLSTLPAAAQRSFPPCMRAMKGALDKNHHLKHNGRLQYGLFIKGIGISLEDALVYWRREFTKNGNIDDKKFDSAYAYNIKHSYGKAGKRTDYSPYSCLKIIQSAPVAGDTHGCPFRHYDEQALRDSLFREFNKKLNGKVETKDIDELVRLARSHHYQIACKRHFEITHPSPPLSVAQEMNELLIHHPNQYFEESEKFWKASSGAEVGASSAASSSSYSSLPTTPTNRSTSTLVASALPTPSPTLKAAEEEKEKKREVEKEKELLGKEQEKKASQSSNTDTEMTPAVNELK